MNAIINAAVSATVAKPVVNNFDMYDKGLELVGQVLGEELSDVFNIIVTKGVCKVVLPLSVSLAPVSDRDDITVNFMDNNSVITIH